MFKNAFACPKKHHLFSSSRKFSITVLIRLAHIFSKTFSCRALAASSGLDKSSLIRSRHKTVPCCFSNCLKRFCVSISFCSFFNSSLVRCIFDSHCHDTARQCSTYRVASSYAAAKASGYFWNQLVLAFCICVLI
jgi:hypothetical protein